MSISESRYAIVESVSSMNSHQTRKVLDFIRKISRKENKKDEYSKFRRQAMEDINRALREGFSY